MKIISKLLRTIPASTIDGNRPGRSTVGVKMMPFHQVSFKTLAFNGLLGGDSYKQFPSAATCANLRIARSLSFSIWTVCSRYWHPYKCRLNEIIAKNFFILFWIKWLELPLVLGVFRNETLADHNTCTFQLVRAFSFRSLVPKIEPAPNDTSTNSSKRILFFYSQFDFDFDFFTKAW